MTIKPRNILILSANPKRTARLRLDEELRDIKEGLQRAPNRQNFNLRYELAARPRDIRRAILDYRPNIIHFSGHGAGVQGLVFENETGEEQLVTGEALAGLFKQFSKQVECVLLNACYSETQADAITQHINYVIGMNDQIQDKAAIEFVVGFYDALLAYNPEYDSGCPVEFAFNIAKSAIAVAGVSGELIPVLRKKHTSVNNSTSESPTIIPKNDVIIALPNPIKLFRIIASIVPFQRNAKPVVGISVLTTAMVFFSLSFVPKLKDEEAFKKTSPISPSPIDIPIPEKEFVNKNQTVVQRTSVFSLKSIDVPKGRFRYGGSTSWAPIHPKLESEIKKAHPSFDIEAIEELFRGSGIGIQRLIDGGQDGLDFALSSREVNSREMNLANKKDLTLETIPITKSGLAVAVNILQEAKPLTIKQLGQIFTGEIQNWSEVSVLADLPIKPYVRWDNRGTLEEMAKLLRIDVEKIYKNKNIERIHRTTEGITKVGEEPGGIVIGPISELVPQCGIKTVPLINKKDEIVTPYQKENFVSYDKCTNNRRNKVNISAIQHNEYPLITTYYVVVKKKKKIENDDIEYKAGRSYADLLLTDESQRLIQKLQETGNLDKK